ncbi:MAG: FG-GAP repeat protein [Candidatus Moranbacteria bacterium GW2011_GWF1_34_10]|nr:MAG: FG-GAP repeat protein [Candidatus Moranbacteria bacterium GW2011_GWF1_34_10]
MNIKRTDNEEINIQDLGSKSPNSKGLLEPKIFFKTKRKLIFSFLLILLIIFSFYFVFSSKENILNLDDLGKMGEEVEKDFNLVPTMALAKNDQGYELKDDAGEGIRIEFANETEEQKKVKEENKKEFKIQFPNDYLKPIEVKLDPERVVTITDQNANDYKAKLLAQNISLTQNQQENISEKELLSNNYLLYENGRKSIYYAYQKDQALNERKLKNWIIYNNPTKNQSDKIEEKESYKIENAKIKKNDQGQIEVFYFGQKEIQNEKTMAEVDSSLLERAQKTLEKEMGEDLINNENKTPDFIIPQPYYLNTKGERTDLNWEINTTENIISLNFSPKTEDYPLALDPTLSFTAPGIANGGDVITGEANSSFGISMTSGDFNTDGKTDLAIGAYGYSTSTGRAYIFYNDSSISATANTADITITGEASSSFGVSMTSGDFNADGKTDLAVGAYTYSTSTGRLYIFHNDGSIPITALTADVIITGEASSYFCTVVKGDFNADGKIDLAVGAQLYSSSAGRTYIFYNDGSIPTTAATADVIITGEANSSFGQSMVSGNFNSDSKTDLAIGAYTYSTNTGRTYIFYNDGSIPTTAATADVIITGEASSSFGTSMMNGDFNADGKTDLAVGAQGYSTNTGRTYIFYNDGSIPTTAATADVIITGEASSYFGQSMTNGDFNTDGKTDLAVGAFGYSSYAGRAYIFYSQNGQVNTNFSVTGEAGSYLGYSMTSGDFNADGKIDLAVGAYNYSSGTGRAYIFYNDGLISTTAATADVIITGGATSNYFSYSMTSGDFNADGKTDLAVGSMNYSSGTGRAYIFYNDGSIPTTAATADVTITGEASSSFGTSMINGDFNADGKTDLVVGAYAYSSYAGRTYIFYNDGVIPTTAATADVIITGESGSYFGEAMTSGDFNADGKIDLAVGGDYYSTQTGRVYIFYNDGSIPTTAATADVTITGEASSRFGYSMTSGDFNADGKNDLAVGAEWYNTYAGSIYIFYNDGSIPTTAATADVTITGEASSRFGCSMTSGDFNADGKNDLAVGAYGYLTNTGRTYIFYNDGSIPTTAVTSDVIITGETTNNYFGISMTSGDFNADGKTDLTVGAWGYSTNTGRVYIYETRDDYAWQIQTQPGNLRTDPKVGQEMKINGGSASNYFGSSMISGDFNADGKTDLAVGSYGYSTNAGRVYIFYNDGFIPVIAAIADVIITGEASSSFGYSMTSGDFNADGKTDLAVAANTYSTNTGRVYIFHNDGSVPTTAATADVIITGETTSNLFGASMTSGDFNADGKTDLAVGAYGYSSNTGRAYIFYNDGSVPTTAATADVIITGETTSNLFGSSMTSGDFNADGKFDLVVGAQGSAGHAYIFYNDGSIPTTAAAADLIITGEVSSCLGRSMISGDFNVDGKTDLAVGAHNYSSGTGRVYIFYNDGSIPTTAETADVKITGEASSYFGVSMTSGDFNFDRKTDLAVGAYAYSSNTGRAYILYNDGSIPTTAVTADVIITGEVANSSFGYSMTGGDFNSDGKTDLAVGAIGYSSNTGQTYIYTFNDSQAVGGATNNNFGYSMTTGDFNADGKTDLAVGASAYSSATGRAYIFYNRGSVSASISTADVIITGETTSNSFGIFMTSGDFNADGKVDLAVGANGYSSGAGRTYIFHNDGSIPTTAATADVIITGEASSGFGTSIINGDFNVDGKTDLAIGAWSYPSGVGRAYIFYNDGSIPTTAATADVVITGEASSYFGYSMTSGDFNADGKTDLAVGAFGYSSLTGRVYIFYNDGSIPTSTANADAIITGESLSGFGASMTSGDFNADGKTDLAVGAYDYSSGIGRAYIFYNDGSISTVAAMADVTITGESGAFGISITDGDFNADGKTDLAVGAYTYSSNTGRAYIFYNDSKFPSTANNADEIITGEATNNYFGFSMTEGDFNTDSKTDLAIGAYGYSTNTGKAYIIITEAINGEQINIIKQKGSIKLKGGSVKMK